MNMAALQSPDPVCRAGSVSPPDSEVMDLGYKKNHEAGRAGSVSPPDSEVMDLGYKKNHEAERSTLHGKKETPVKTGVS